MTAESFDLIVIGAGSAAREGANRAAREHGARVAMIERERWGGSCPNVAKRGLYKIVFERGSRKVLGLHVVNRSAAEIVQSLAVALGAAVDDLAAVHHTYPSLGEGVKAAAEKAVGA